MRTSTGTTGRTQVAIYIRLSRETAESASVDTQRAAALTWLKANGFADADITEYVDSGVSGAKALEDRQRMRQLMRDRPNVIIAWKLDRYARSVSEFLRLVGWGEAHNVCLATTDNVVNTTTPTGRMVAVVLAALAEWEREMIKGRILDGHATRRTQGRWISGNAPFGYRIERRDGAAYLAIDEEQAEQVRAAVRSLINDDDGTVASTSRMLGIGERQWRRMLKSPNLRGQREHKGQLIVAEDGITPVHFAEPIITAAEAKAVRERLNALATGKDRAPRKAAPLCAGLAFCAVCDGRVNGGKLRNGVARYRCKTGHVSITAEHVDRAVEAEFRKRFGLVDEYVVRLEGGNDMSEAMAEAQEKADRIATQMASAGPLMLATLNEKAAELEAAYAALKAAHDPDVREVLEPTGRTLGEAWDSDPGVRTGLLGDLGLTVVVSTKAHAERLEISWASGGEDYALTEYLEDM
jgi:DNA invertase Pin-like site-specific DNA recombinase